MGNARSFGERVVPKEIVSIIKINEPEIADLQNVVKNNSFGRSAKLRNTTDIPFLLFMAFFYVVLAGFFIYCISNGDIYRILNGYDQCGNVCGRNNERLQKYDMCSGVNMSEKPYLLVMGSSGVLVDISKVQRECVQDCRQYSNHTEFLNRCIPIKSRVVVNTIFSKTGLKNFFQEVSEDLDLCWKDIIYLCIISLVFSIAIMILLRYLVGIVVWLVMIGVCLACVIGTIYLWILWKNSGDAMMLQRSEEISDIENRKNGSYLVFAIVATVVTFCVIAVILVMRKRIRLVIELFKEAGKAVAAMPLLLLEPFLTFASLGAVLALWVYFSIWVESSGFLETENGLVYYRKNFWMKLTRWYNLLGMLWMCQFVIGCQHMVIAGAVSSWYFTRNKSDLSHPTLYSAYNLLRYHLGTVAFGSFTIAVVQLLRLILKIMEKFANSKTQFCCRCCVKCCQTCLGCLSGYVKYLSRNAYVETAMYGYSYCKAAKQAHKILVSNILRVAAINSVGDFVLLLGKVLVVMATVSIAVEILEKKRGLQHMWIPVAIAGLCAYFISHCFITVFEMTIDTLFLCFCEDSEQNDGIGRPYYMPRGLLKFVENSKKAIAVHDLATSNNRQAWQESVTKQY